MAFEGLTNKGREYMAKCLAENKPITFVKVKIGDGNIGLGENPETFLDIKSIKKEVSIADKIQDGDMVKLLIQIDNTGVSEGYFPREIGIYVSDEGQEILYWYINDGSETSWLPPANKSPVKFKYYINLMATNLDTVIVNWSGTELWVDREFLGKEMEKKLPKGSISEKYNTAEKIVVELDKKASKKQLGRIIIGDNLDIDEEGKITHPKGNGNSHIPINGATGQFLKWLSAGIAQWASITWNDITGKPSSFTPSSHKHTKNQITDFDHTHDDRYYTETEIDTKFKNYCPISVGSIDVRYDNKNPAELYAGTTWELLASDKYIRTGNIPLSTGGSNSVNILKENLPNIKLSTEPHIHTQPTHQHDTSIEDQGGHLPTGMLGKNKYNELYHMAAGYTGSILSSQVTPSGGDNTGSSSPKTEALGNGTALSIQPAYITLKFWKRLT